MDIQEIIKKLPRRGFDNYVLGPFMIYYGIKSKAMPKRMRRILVGAGIFQVFYAWNDYLKLQGKITTVLNLDEPEVLS